MSSMTAYEEALFAYHEPHELMRALHEVHGELDDAQFWKLFRQSWQRSKSFARSSVEIRQMLTAERLHAIPERYAAFLPDEVQFLKNALRRDKPVKLYRGGSLKNLTGFSWTPKKTLAEEFATHCGNDDPHIVAGYLEPRKIILYLRARNEVVCFPEDIENYKVSDGVKPDEDTMNQDAIKAALDSVGVAKVAQKEPWEYLEARIAAGALERQSVLDFMNHTIGLLEPLGFKARVEYAKDIIKHLEGSKCHSEPETKKAGGSATAKAAPAATSTKKRGQTSKSSSPRKPKPKPAPTNSTKSSGRQKGASPTTS